VADSNIYVVIEGVSTDSPTGTCAVAVSAGVRLRSIIGIIAHVVLLTRGANALRQHKHRVISGDSAVNRVEASRIPITFIKGAEHRSGELLSFTEIIDSSRRANRSCRYLLRHNKALLSGTFVDDLALPGYVLPETSLASNLLREFALGHNDCRYRTSESLSRFKVDLYHVSL